MKKIICLILLSIFFLGACSTRKDTFINRNYHNVSTKYNVLYNGNIALEKGIEEINTEYEDNYWAILPIEPLKINEETFVLPGEGEKDNGGFFDTAEKKAVKAVQKHGMNIAGKEHNRQIDDAYFLLGKARYYSQRFVPALEAFEFVLKHYPSGDLNQELQIWKAKTQIRLQNEEQAVLIIKNILKSRKLEKNIKEDSHTALAMAYVALDSFPQAMEQLEKAVKTHENKEQYARNLFILGQLYRQNQNLDSSQLAFQQILDFKKSPYKYKIYSYIEQVKNSTDSTDNSQLQDKIYKLIKERENRPYLDALYYQAAQLDFQENDATSAIENLINSVHTPLAKKFQRGVSYEKLGDFYFDKALFVKAGAYYDSVMPNVTNENTKRIRKLKRKRKSLEEIILHETILKRNDSILNLVAMSDAKRTTYFEQHIAEIKKADKLAAILKENAERSNTSGNAFAGGGKQNNTSGKWYFYNMQTVGFGKAEFQKIWGNRELKDNWRLSENRNKLSDDLQEASDNSLTSNANIDESKKYDVNYYISLIPSDKQDIQVMRENNGNALYQLGIIYKEQFQEYDLATQKLERFLSESPKENLVLPAKYHLYKIFKLTNNPKLNQLKQEIVSEYPESRFAKIILNPDVTSFNDEIGSPESHYEKVYCDFEYEKYPIVVSQCNEAIKKYIDDPIQAKFELLKAYALLKTENKEAFIKGLEFVVNNYPKTEESDHAQEVLDLLNGVKKPVNNEINKKENDTKKVDTNTKKVETLTDEEKKQKVLELMKKRGGPPKVKTN